jgi:MFS transporter, DHA2 family, multidrug resistance protein
MEAVLADKPLIVVKHRIFLLAAVMAVSICQFLDATIANVALPHMQAALGASIDTISWVLTSFIIAGAIATPITGWLSDRIGSRNLFLGATVGFLLSSAACGTANSLGSMVAFRAIQGIAGAFLGPMTQTIMFDISPPSKQAATMSAFGMVVMIAPISGPFLGGFLTETLNWRWIYYVNLPIGIPALAALWWLLPSRPAESRKLDIFGFAALGLGLGALQLMLDRGQGRDWFNSWEIIIEGIIVVSSLWIFLVHTRTATRTLFSGELFREPSFLVGCAFMAVLGLTNIALSAVLPTMYQSIYHYPVMFTGLLMAPRGLGVATTSLLAGRFFGRMDYRYLITIGYVITAASMWIMTTWSIDMGYRMIVVSSFIQGIGLGVLFAPMNLIAFSAIKPELRPDGAGLLALFRNLGGSIGISVIVTLMARNQQVSHADLAAHITPGSIPAIDLSAVVERLPGVGTGVVQMINNEVTRQAFMIAYLDNFVMIGWLLLVIAPLPLFLKKPDMGAAMRPVISE